LEYLKEGSPKTGYPFEIVKDLSRNKLCILVLRFRSDLFDPKTQNYRNSSNYFEDFAVEARAKMA